MAVLALLRLIPTFLGRRTERRRGPDGKQVPLVFVAYCA